MSRKVFVTTYEVIGTGIPIYQEFEAKRKATNEAGHDLADEFGAQGFRPFASCGRPRTMIFKDNLPKGWRKIGMVDGMVEAVPNKGTKAGKEAQQRMSAIEAAPEAMHLAGQLGYNPREMAMDGFSIYFPTALAVAHPEPRFFVRIPRTAGDGFEPDPAILRALPESEFMKAIEDHNAEAARTREAA